MAMTLDPLLLSRLQFFWVIALHILLPAFTIGLACYRALGMALLADGRAGLFPHLGVLAEDFCDLLWAWRRLGDRHAVPVRHQLEPLLGCDGQHRRAADGL